MSVFFTNPLLLYLPLSIVRWYFYLPHSNSCIISSRSLRQISSSIHHDKILSLSSSESDVHKLQLLHDVDQCNLYFPWTLGSTHSIYALKDYVFHISRHLANRNPDVVSNRYNLFLITFEYFRVSYHLLISLYWWDRSNSYRSLRSVKNRQRRIPCMIHNSVIAHRLDITST